MEFIIHTPRLEHLNVRFVDVFYVLFRLSPSQHALRGLQCVIDKEKAWRETTTGSEHWQEQKHRPGLQH